MYNAALPSDYSDFVQVIPQNALTAFCGWIGLRPDTSNTSAQYFCRAEATCPFDSNTLMKILQGWAEEM